VERTHHPLSEPLSQHPEQAIDAVLKTYNGNYGLFIYGGARLLKNIFPDFPPEFQQQLLEIVQSKEEKGLLFVMAMPRKTDCSGIEVGFLEFFAEIATSNFTAGSEQFRKLAN